MGAILVVDPFNRVTLANRDTPRFEHEPRKETPGIDSHFDGLLLCGAVAVIDVISIRDIVVGVG